ncbi:MAG: DUF3617 domain-containing protein [Betaproteobacteria bacterium]|jgi:hypothetical protein|nr:DUF3617 domain-containing protein [Betaproteobacteria bacterium]
MKKRLLVLALLAGLSSGAAAQERGMEPGEWELTTTISSPMMPQPQTATVKHCIKAEDLAEPSRWMGGAPPGSDCKLTPLERDGKSASWEMACPSSGFKGRGRARFAKGMMDSEMQISGTQDGKKFEMKTRTRGRRLGPCQS